MDDFAGAFQPALVERANDVALHVEAAQLGFHVRGNDEGSARPAGEAKLFQVAEAATEQRSVAAGAAYHAGDLSAVLRRFRQERAVEASASSPSTSEAYTGRWKIGSSSLTE